VTYHLFAGDNIATLHKLIADGVQVDSIVTDPPYGLSFMGKKWDYDVPSVEFWELAIQVLRPGGYVLSFGGTRTYHRMVVNMEDAGFEIGDQLVWIYGSGFPKSMNISKAIDKAAGAIRPFICEGTRSGSRPYVEDQSQGKAYRLGSGAVITASVTEDAKKWEGWGTALKPALEPIVMARKPFSKDTEKAGATLGVQSDATRFFYCAKASKKERSGSKHPTVKPIALMRYLVRLVTPLGGTVMDPFAGSGTTGVAGLLEGFVPVLMEMDNSYVLDMRERLDKTIRDSSGEPDLLADLFV